MEPLVSIIIPVYNRCQFLGETLDSVLAQTYKNWECLLVDDGSEDYSKELCDFYVEKEKRFKWYANTKKGAASARNLGIKHAAGDFIQFLDSDDLISNEKIENQVGFLEKYETFDLVTCPWGRFEHTIKEAKIYNNLPSYKNFVSLDEFLIALSKSFGFFPLHSYLFKRELIETSGYWSEMLSLNDDTEFLFRQFLTAGKIGHTKYGNAFYRVLEASSISKYDDREKVRNAILAWRIIEIRLKLLFKEEHIFVHKEKNLIFLKLKSTFPELIDENTEFFDEQIKEQRKKNLISKKIGRKLKVFLINIGSLGDP